MSTFSTAPMLRPALEAEGERLESPLAGPVWLYSARPSAAARSPVLLVHSVNAAASAYEMKPIFDFYAAQSGPEARAVYALDLPGFGRSDRSDRDYCPRLMTDAVLLAADHIRSAQGAVHVIALSLGCEFAARAALEQPAHFATLSLVSPTGFNASRRGEQGASLGSRSLHRFLSWSVWADGLFDNLTRPSVVRYFLERTYGRKGVVDEGLWRYAVDTAREPGAKRAPLYFLSALLFSKDATSVYEQLTLPVWMSHGVRGDFVDYREAESLRGKDNWAFDVFDTGAMPHFEQPDLFMERHQAFLEAARRAVPEGEVAEKAPDDERLSE